MEDIRLAPVGVYSSQLEADLVVARLETAGIQAYVRSDGLGGAFPGMPMATGGFQVMVAESEVEAGRDVVRESGNQALDRSTGMLDGRRWAIIRWVVPIAALLIVGLGLIQRPF